MLTDDLLDFDDDDLVIIDKQESIFMTQLNSCQTGPVNTLDTRTELNILQGRLATATQELALISSEKVAKDGEVAMLRVRLSSLESEKFEASKRHAAKLEALQQERQSLIAHWQREIERLQTELEFQKTETISAHKPTWPDSEMQGDSFTGFFPDLVGNDIHKRPRKSRILFEDFSCEVDFSVESMKSMPAKLGTSSIPQLDLLGILLKSIGCADQVIAHEDILEKDRESIAKIRENIHNIAFNTQNALLPVEYYFRKLSLASSHILTHYILTILEFFVCMNEPIGLMILMGNTDFVEEALSKTAILLGDKEPILGPKTQLLEHLCEYLQRLPQGRGYSVVHQLLRIVKHVVYKTTRDAPSCILALLDDGVLLDKLDSFHQDYDEITLDIAQLIQLISHDARVPTLVFKQIPSHGCSLLDLFNDIIADKLEESEYHEEISEELDFVITFLEGFVSRRIFPASVAFEPRTLRLFARELAKITHNRQGLDVSRREFDVQRLVKIMNLVALTEKAPIVKLLDREIFCLVSAALKISDEGQFPNIKPLIKDLKRLLDQEYLNIKQGHYSLVPMPTVRRRVKPLTEDEELAMYEEMKQGTLVDS